MKIRKLKIEDRLILKKMISDTKMFTKEETCVAMELIDTVLYNKNQKDYIIYLKKKAKQQGMYVMALPRQPTGPLTCTG